MTHINVPVVISPAHAAALATFFSSAGDASTDNEHPPTVVLYEAVARALVDYRAGAALQLDLSGFRDANEAMAHAAEHMLVSRVWHERDAQLAYLLRELADALWTHGKRLLWASVDPSLDDPDGWTTAGREPS
ncbi:hypothetical protein ASD11_07305 [Aeromicrobium sp. Root495]|uniref:hypothetical protein n=1 Tax=Aeromicrobium sp. Root495 TaxID=1736550 RepID=UPI0007015556|nr:hypothetical protein [Aeromicrobium sp. Root495]KQY59368.1 hypothetical protein ASD11_07305 [Aeromicrobium sp. Root495]